MRQNRAVTDAPASLGPDPAERAFYVDEFAGATIVVALVGASASWVDGVASAVVALRGGGSRLVLVTSDPDAALRSLEVAGGVHGAQVVEGTAPDLDGATAALWMAVVDDGAAVVAVPAGSEASAAAVVAASVRARKLVITDLDGGWGRPPRSFADLATHDDALRSQLADRQGGAVVLAVEAALEADVENVNLCHPADLDTELFTFDGAGTLFTRAGYLELGPLGVDDLAAVERLVAQGIADGLLRPRTRAEVARLAVTGLGARVRVSGHLAGIASLELAPYVDEGAGEVACLYTVSRFSGAGAGALLVDGLLARAHELGLSRLFAVTVSDLAAAFFVRRGFVEVDQGDLPAAKWQGYDAERRLLARALLLEVGHDDANAGSGGSEGAAGF